MECIVEPELELDIKSFEVKLHFVAIHLNEPSDDLSEYQIQVECLGEKLIASNVNDARLKLENNTLDHVLNITCNSFSNIPTHEKFMFPFFGNPLIIQLVKVDMLPDPQSSKKKANKKINSNIPTAAYTGQINVFECLMSNQSNEDILVLNLLKLDEESLKEVISMHYTIKFHDPPEICNTFSINSLSLLNFPKNYINDNIKIGFHLPLYVNSYEMIYLRDSPNEQLNNSELTGLHYDSYLKESGFQIDLSNVFLTHLCYQNYLTEKSVNLLKQLNKEGLKLLFEIKVTNMSAPHNHFMTMLDLGIFNHQGVKNIKFVLPLYDYNANYVKEHFNIDVSLYPVDEVIKDKNKKKPIKEEADVTSLIPFTLEGNQIAILVEFQLTQPFNNEQSLDELKELLHQQIPFLDKRSDQEKALQDAQKCFTTSILNISEGLENFISLNQHLDHFELQNKINFFLENDQLIKNGELKESIKMLISNQFNVETKTQSNHEFKILMIKVYEMLTQESSKILHQKKIRDNSKLIECFREQTVFFAEEFLLLNDPQKGEKLFVNLTTELDENTLIDYSIFCIKRKEYEKCEKIALQLLQKNSNSVFAFYLLSYLKYLLGKNDVILLLFKIMLKLSPKNLELWILYKLTCEKLDDKNGVDVCTVKIDELNSETLEDDFCEFQNVRKPLSWIELKTSNAVHFIINRQLKMGLLEYSSLIREYSQNSQSHLAEHFDLKYLQLIELMIEEDYESGLKQLQDLQMNDDTEIMLRYVKGNLLYNAGNISRAICEYEIAFNINVKSSQDKFLHMPTMRCGKAYILNFPCTAKAKKYYHCCCKYFPTFNSWTGLGIVYRKETDFDAAEKCDLESKNILRRYGMYHN
ncbi:unnamed protein product [Diamesa serratosioi]